jgi:uncharacterized protein
MNEEFYNKLKEEIQPYFEKTGSHDFNHTERVYHNAMRIAEATDGVDMDILKACTLMHDISRLREDEIKGLDHATDGAKVAKEILEKTEFPKDKIETVANAIASHRYSKGIIGETIEARILQDADRLDALGAICIARIFDRGGVKRRPMHDPSIPIEPDYSKSKGTTAINHFNEKILKITPDKFNTPKAQELAKDKYAFTKEYVERFEKEWRGEL